MKHLANKEIFNTLSDIGIVNFTINNDGTVDVDGDVNISRRNLDKIPVQFGNVTGFFDCGYNHLTSLSGVPNQVGGNFYCHFNQLTTLVGSPVEVGGHFYCNYNQSKYVDGFFFCNNNQLTTLEGSPKYVGDEFYCNHNKLTSLVGAPLEIKGSFVCLDNPLPQEIFDNYKDIKYIIKYQDLYNIWRNDGSLDKFRFGEMMTDK